MFKKFIAWVKGVYQSHTFSIHWLGVIVALVAIASLVLWVARHEEKQNSTPAVVQKTETVEQKITIEEPVKKPTSKTKPIPNKGEAIAPKVVIEEILIKPPAKEEKSTKYKVEEEVLEPSYKKALDEYNNLAGQQ